MSGSNGFAVASSGASIQTATGPNKLLSINNPFTKLDTTNIVSFQTIKLILNHEPPQAPNAAPWYTDTVVYQFAHGYNYKPAIWMSWQFPAANPQPGNPPVSGSNTVSYPNGDDTCGDYMYYATTGNVLGGVSVVLLAIEQYNNAGSVLQATQAYLYATVDNTNVYIHIMKQTMATVGGAIVPLYLIGYVLNLRVYVFTEPATTSTY